MRSAAKNTLIWCLAPNLVATSGSGTFLIRPIWGINYAAHVQYLYIRCGVDTPYIPIPLPTPWAFFIHPSCTSTTACDLLQSTCYSTTVFIYFPPSAATPRDTRPDSCKMHPTCPVCSAAMDGPGKTCPSCGAVRYLFLDLFFRFSLPGSLHRSGWWLWWRRKKRQCIFQFQRRGWP